MGLWGSRVYWVDWVQRTIEHTSRRPGLEGFDTQGRPVVPDLPVEVVALRLATRQPKERCCSCPTCP